MIHGAQLIYAVVKDGATPLDTTRVLIAAIDGLTYCVVAVCLAWAVRRPK